jgi:hypothetical protein
MAEQDGAILEIDFEWQRDEAGYRLINRPSRNPALAAKGGALRPHRPLEYHATLFKQFAEIETPNHCLAFAECFGLLGVTNTRDGSESVILWLAEAADLREALNLYEREPAMLLIRYGAYCSANIEAKLTAGEPSGRPVLTMVPRSLLAAIKLQFLRHVSSGNTLRACENCGVWFTVGAGGRRRDARFHSNQCSIDYHNRRRAKGGKR